MTSPEKEIPECTGNVPSKYDSWANLSSSPFDPYLLYLTCKGKPYHKYIGK